MVTPYTLQNARLPPVQLTKLRIPFTPTPKDKQNAPRHEPNDPYSLSENQPVVMDEGYVGEKKSRHEFERMIKKKLSKLKRKNKAFYF